MEFNLRTLQASDLFMMVKIINKIGINNVKGAIDTEKIKNARKNMTEENRTEVMTDVGMEVTMSVMEVVLEKLPIIEDELYNFMGAVSGIKSKEVAKLSINDFMALFVAICKKEEFKDFFNQALQLIKLA